MATFIHILIALFFIVPVVYVPAFIWLKWRSNVQQRLVVQTRQP